MARDGYTELPYHNWQHALDTRDEARRLVGYCQDNSLGLDGFVTEAASLLHDYDYHKRLPASVRSRELRSSRAASAVLRAHGPAGGKGRRAWRMVFANPALSP